MLETPHVAVGAAIAARIPNPLISIPLAFGSHFLLDMMPHWNPHLYTESKKYGKPSMTTTIITTCDVLLALVVGSSIAFAQSPNTAHVFSVFIASFMSVAPDVVEGPYYWLRQHTPNMEKWITFQRKIQNDVPFVPGMIIQTLTVIAALLISLF